MAAFQALIELNLCCPERLRSAELSDKIIILESFWDSGVQRFGEEGAKGWSFWMDNKESLHAESESSGKGIYYNPTSTMHILKNGKWCVLRLILLYFENNAIFQSPYQKIFFSLNL